MMIKFEKVCLVAITVALMMAFTPIMAEKPGDAAKDAKSPKAVKADSAAKASKGDQGPKFSPHYRALISAAQLTDAQQVELRKLLDARTATRKANAQALAAAKSANDKDKTQSARDKAKADEVAAEAAMMAILKPQQARSWRAYEFYHRQSQKLRKANMTDEQKAKARAMAEEIAAQQKVDGKSDDSALGQAYQAYLDRVTAEVLTDEQRAALTKKPEKKGQAKETPKGKAAKDTGKAAKSE